MTFYGDTLKVSQLVEEVSIEDRFGRVRTANADYPVVAILNPGDGPDEVEMRVTNLSWDHSKGLLRLEVDND